MGRGEKGKGREERLPPLKLKSGYALGVTAWWPHIKRRHTVN